VQYVNNSLLIVHICAFVKLKILLAIEYLLLVINEAFIDYYCNSTFLNNQLERNIHRQQIDFCIQLKTKILKF